MSKRLRLDRSARERRDHSRDRIDIEAESVNAPQSTLRESRTSPTHRIHHGTIGRIVVQRIGDDLRWVLPDVPKIPMSSVRGVGCGRDLTEPPTRRVLGKVERWLSTLGGKTNGRRSAFHTKSFELRVGTRYLYRRCSEEKAKVTRFGLLVEWNGTSRSTESGMRAAVPHQPYSEALA